MNPELFDALTQLQRERGIDLDYMSDRIAAALSAAYKKNKEGYTGNVAVELDWERKTMRMYVQKEVVDDVISPSAEITLEEARRLSPGAELGDLVNVDVDVKKFGRIAAQTAKQVIIQGIREAERGAIFDSFSSKEHEILTGSVLRIEPRSGDMTIRIGTGGDRTDGLLSATEQVRGEQYVEGDIIHVYVVEVRRSNRGPQILVSRTHPGLVKRLFELNVPEIESGQVEIKAISREAGSRTKLAVWAAEPDIDPVGACIGPRRSRVGAVVDELHGEKMDIVAWNEDPAQFVASALAPATVVSVKALPGQKFCRVVVPDDQLSLAIGREGQNARLAARLTGYKIDIRSVSQAGEEPEDEELPEERKETDLQEPDAEETVSQETDSEETDSREPDAEEADSQEPDAEETDSREPDEEETDSQELDEEETDSEPADMEETAPSGEEPENGAEDEETDEVAE